MVISLCSLSSVIETLIVSWWLKYYKIIISKNTIYNKNNFGTGFSSRIDVELHAMLPYQRQLQSFLFEIFALYLTRLSWLHKESTHPLTVNRGNEKNTSFIHHEKQTSSYFICRQILTTHKSCANEIDANLNI